MQGHRPARVVGDHPVGQRTCRRAVLDPRQARHGEQESRVRPQRHAGPEVRQRCLAAIGHGHDDVDLIGPGLEAVARDHLGRAPVAVRLDHRLVRRVLEHGDMLVGVGPRRPVVRDEVGEHHAVAADLAVHHRRQVDQRPSRHTVGRGGFDREGEGQLVVDHGEIAGQPRIAGRDRGRPVYDAHARAGREGRQAKADGHGGHAHPFSQGQRRRCAEHQNANSKWARQRRRRRGRRPPTGPHQAQLSARRCGNDLREVGQIQ